MMDIYNEIIDLYHKNIPIKQIAKELEISEVKVRRVLITECEWGSPTSDEIMALYDRGLTATQIAEELRKPLKTVQAYMPYTRGEYNDGDISVAAQQSKDFRKRKRSVKARQVASVIEQKTAANVSGIDSSGSKDKEMSKIGNKDSKAEKDTKANEAVEYVDIGTWREESGFTGKGHKILKLHMELQMNLDDEEELALRMFGKSESGISRDILVSEDMTLHSLHYAIQRAFGWENGHLHYFAYPENVYNELTGGRLTELLDLCGVYFRYPSDDYQDIYWDDDYDGSMSPRTWLGNKYTGPYYYGGWSEHYMNAQTDARVFRQRHPVLNVGPSFEEFMTGNTESKVKELDDVMVDDVRMYFQSSLDELLERLPIGQVIGLSGTTDWHNEVRKIVADADAGFNENYRQLRICEEKDNDLMVDTILKRSNPKVVPLSDRLIYSYDFGDGWTVEIVCDEIYESFGGWNKVSDAGDVIPPVSEQRVFEKLFEEQTPFDSKGRQVVGEIRDQIANVIVKRRPVCVKADGLPVMDDVGGPHGYCAFLNGIHGLDCGGYEYEDKEEAREWGRSMGWNGRMYKPENIL